MSDNFVKRWLDKSLSAIEGGTYIASPRSEENGGWPELVPFDSVWSNGVFRSSIDGSMTAYFKLKESVRTEWLSNQMQLIDNQFFFNNIVTELAEKLNVGTISKTKDKRRKFSISIVRSEYKQLYRDENDTPATEDYRDRMGENLMRPEWSGYFGVELLPTNVLEESASWQELKENFADRYDDPLKYYLSDYRMVRDLLEAHGLKGLKNCTVDSEDYKNLTSWHGVEVEPFRKSKSLSTTRFQEPVDGYSLITDAWGEVTFYAAVPMKQRADFGEDPISPRAQWGKELFDPSNDVVGIWIKGEIRGREVIKEILNSKTLGRKSSLEKIDENKYSDVERAYKDLMVTAQGEQAAEHNDFLDNMEILVCAQNFVGVDNPLKKHLRQYGMDALLPVNRQADCLVSTIPGSTKSISKISNKTRQSNMTRGQFSCQAFPGAISMSGILRKTKPCAKNGILIGLTDGDNERREVFTAIDAARYQHGSPVMLITGRSGSGKAVHANTLLMTPAGTIRMKDISVGDIILDAEGNPCRVTFATDIYDAEEAWEATTSRGVVVCDANHQWPVVGMSCHFADAAKSLAAEAAQADNDLCNAGELSARVSPLVDSSLHVAWFNPQAVADSLLFTDCPSSEGLFGYRDALYSLAQRMQEVGNLYSSGERYNKITVRDMVRMQGEGECSFLMPTFGEGEHVTIDSIVRVPGGEPVPVRCISVDSATKCFMLDGGIPTGNTQSVLQYICQAVYDNRSVAMLNPKKDGTLQDFFDHLDGITISMSEEYLEENPGMLDPFNFFEDRKVIATVLSDAVSKFVGYNTDKGSAGRLSDTSLKGNITDNTNDMRNNSSYDVIFGNPIGRDLFPQALKVLRRLHDKSPDDYPDLPDANSKLSPDYQKWIRDYLSERGGTPPVFDPAVRETMESLVKISSFWNTILTPNPSTNSDILEKMLTGRPILIEWDGSLKLPDKDLPESDYEQGHLESIVSIGLAFMYADEMIARRNRGGLVVVDEAWVLKKSKEAQAHLNRYGREARQQNIMPILVTQKIQDYLSMDDDSMSSSVNRFLFMATPANDEMEKKLFFKHTGLEEDEATWQYMLKAGVRGSDGGKIANPVARGYYVDNLYDFSSGVTLGPWPARELTLGRTDAEGEALRAKMLAEGEDSITDDEWYEAGGYVLSREDFMDVIRNDDDVTIPEQSGLDVYTSKNADDDLWSG